MFENRLTYWEDFPVGHVAEFGDKVITKNEILDFARKYDPQPFHVDEEAAQKSLFGRLCASGWHTCAIATRMVYDEILHRSTALGSPGVDNLRWLKPIFPNDRLRMRLVVVDARPLNSRPTVGLVKTRWEILNQKDEKVVQMEANIMFGRRPTTDVASNGTTSHRP